MHTDDTNGVPLHIDAEESKETTISVPYEPIERIGRQQQRLRQLREEAELLAN